MKTLTGVKPKIGWRPVRYALKLTGGGLFAELRFLRPSPFDMIAPVPSVIH
jgi:hypothetical protein